MGALFYSPVDFTDASDSHQSVHVWCIGEINRWIKQRTLSLLNVVDKRSDGTPNNNVNTDTGDQK